MNFHDKLIELSKDLGYSRYAGYCFGFSIRWLEACILDEETILEQRADLIECFSSLMLIEAMQKVREKNKNSSMHTLNLLQSNVQDLEAFFDTLNVHQNSDVYGPQISDYFYVNQDNFELVSQWASSEKILALGGLTSLYSESFMGTDEEVKNYLDKLGLILEQRGIASLELFGVVLINHDHANALAYTPEKGWKFMDVNRYSAKKRINFLNTSRIVQEIRAGFQLSSSNPYMVFNVHVISTKNAPLIPNFQFQLTKFKMTHVITPQKAKHHNEHANLAYIAAQGNHPEVITELAKYSGVNLNTPSPNGYTPLRIATRRGYHLIIAELAKDPRVDLNAPNDKGLTPIFLAVAGGHVKVVAELAKHIPTNLETPNQKGITPAYCAAVNGHGQIIAQLAAHPYTKVNTILEHSGNSLMHAAADNGHTHLIAQLAKLMPDTINRANNEGMTPAYLAAVRGNPDFIAKLAEYIATEINTPCVDDGSTPLHAAAGRGNLEVIIEFAKHPIDLNVADKQGGTPMFMAVQENKLLVVNEFLKRGVKTDIPLRSSVSALKKFALNYDFSVQGRMSEFLQPYQDNEEAQVNLTPYAIAGIMGHKSMQNLLEEHQPAIKLLYYINQFKAQCMFLSSADVAKELVQKLEKLTQLYVLQKSNLENAELLISLRHKFKNKLAQIELEMQRYPNLSMSILIHMTIAANEIDLLIDLEKDAEILPNCYSNISIPKFFTAGNDFRNDLTPQNFKKAKFH